MTSFWLEIVSLIVLCIPIHMCFDFSSRHMGIENGKGGMGHSGWGYTHEIMDQVRSEEKFGTGV